MKITDRPIVVEQVFAASIPKVWSAITTHEEMTQWFFENIASFIPEVGFETQFKIRSEERVFTHQWKITEVIPFRKITYNRKYEEYPGDSLVSFELFAEKNKVRLRLSMIVVEDFPDEIPEFSRTSCIEGWHYFLGGNLKNYLGENHETEAISNDKLEQNKC